MFTYEPGYRNEEIQVPREQVIGGAAIGIIVTGAWIARIPGDVGNPTTFNFPVHYKMLKDANLSNVVSGRFDQKEFDKLLEGVRELQALGCRAVSTTCGYYGNYQPQVAAAVDIPVFLSSLMQVPMVKRALKPGQKVGILCANGAVLPGAPALKYCGIDEASDVIIAGTEHSQGMKDILGGTGHLNPGAFEPELIKIAADMVKKHPEVGAIVIECANLPPYAHSIQRATRLPVFDFTTLINWIYSAVVRRPFPGWV
jgi:hypothetical protein